MLATNFKIFSIFHQTQGYESETYHRVRVNFRGDSFLVGGHQLAYWVENNFSPMIDSTLQISHICHLASCAKVDHLTLESSKMNNDRKICKNAQKCQGHGDDHPKCIFKWSLTFLFFSWYVKVASIRLIAIQLREPILQNPYSKTRIRNPVLENRSLETVLQNPHLLIRHLFRTPFGSNHLTGEKRDSCISII